MDALQAEVDMLLEQVFEGSYLQGGALNALLQHMIPCGELAFSRAGLKGVGFPELGADYVLDGLPEASCIIPVACRPDCEDAASGEPCHL